MNKVNARRFERINLCKINKEKCPGNVSAGDEMPRKRQKCEQKQHKILHTLSVEIDKEIRCLPEGGGRGTVCAGEIHTFL